MAYRRRQNLSRSSTFKEEFHPPPSSSSSSISSPPLIDNNKDSSSDDKTCSSFFSSSPSLAAQAIKASAAASRRNPSLSFAFNPSPDHHRSKSFDAYGGKSDSKNGFWGVLAQKAKSILDDDNNNNNNSQQKHDIIPETHKSRSFNTFSGPSAPQTKPSYQYFESNNGKLENPKFRKGLDKITSSLNQLGDTFEKAFEEGKTIVESKTADLRTQIMRKGSNGSEELNQSSDLKNPWQQQGQTQNLTNRDTQLKASRDVAMATAAKAKLLLRELKTVKADLAFAKARCAQLEEENKMLRDREGTDNKGHSREDDDLIRHQLETLLAEKARLASENEIYARENRFLRETVEYHQLTMQDVVYLDEGMEEVTEVYPVDENGVPRMLSMSPHSSSSLLSPTSPDEVVYQSEIPKEMFPVPEEDSKSTTSEDEPPPPPSDSVSKHAK